jgi:DNA-binding transcriptional ArsR family regulator
VVLVFDVIAERHRRQILDLLRLREQSVGELVTALGVSQPAVSKHLRLLRDAGLVESRVEAQRRVYRVRVEPLLEVDAWLAPYRMMWSASLNRLERHLDQMDDESSGG